VTLTPKAVTAALIGVESPLQTFALQRAINEYPQEPLLAVLPGVALQELWGIVGIAETALLVVSAMVVVTALIGMMATIFSSLNERRREMAILRAMGARPATILGMLVLEAIVMAAIGALLGVVLLYIGLIVAQPLVDQAFGLWLPSEIMWDDLIPPGVPYSEIIGEGEMDLVNDTWNPIYDANGVKLNDDLDGSYIKMPGFVIPLETTAAGVTNFILVPYAGACIHTPPPPANQLVMVDRRAVLTGMATAALVPHAARADDVVDLAWEDLLPENTATVPQVFQDLIDHDQPPLSSQQPPSSGVRTDWNGQVVRMPGFIVPIDYSGTGVTAFILVPYVGACVHVPPPPANQLVFVTTAEPYDSKGLFEPVHVTGMFGVSSTFTQLAEVGYALSADEIAPYA